MRMSQRLKTYDGYLIDLDGTMYLGTEKIKEAAPFVRALRQAEIPYLFVTNNSSMEPREIADVLDKHHIPATEDHIFTSSMATASFIKEHHHEARCYVIGEQGLVQALQQEGIAQTTAHPSHVVVGIDRALTYEKLAQACVAIRGGAMFIATNQDAAIPTERGLLPGNGAITAAIRESTGVEPNWIGKPSSIIMKQALERLGVGNDVIMIGDNYATDIMAGMQAGIDTLLVCTGVTDKQEVNDLPVQPTYVIDNLAQWHVP